MPAGGTATSPRGCKTGAEPHIVFRTKMPDCWMYSQMRMSIMVFYSFEGFSSGKGVKVSGGAAAAAAPSTPSTQAPAAAPAGAKAPAAGEMQNHQHRTACAPV